MEWIVEDLAQDIFPGTPVFQLSGDEGRGRLQSALAQPHWPQHRTAQQKAAALHYSLNKNHPYIDGNKRLAVTAMEWFLWMNGFWLLATNDELIDFALDVANDVLSREESADWIVARTLRLSWTAERTARWLAARSEGERSAIAAALADGRPFTAQHLQRWRPLLEAVARSLDAPDV